MYKLPEKCASLKPFAPDTGTYRMHLEANESFLLPTEEDRAMMAEVAAETALNRRPDPSASDLCAAFAARYGLDPAAVTAANGRGELVDLLGRLLLDEGKALLALDCDFAADGFCGALNGIRTVVCPKNDDLSVNVDAVIAALGDPSVGMLLFSNPCDPTSLGLCREEVLRIVDATDKPVVVDEAYMDFWDQSVLPDVASRDNLIVLRSASAAIGLAALQIGFAVAAPTVTDAIRAAKSPRTVSAVTAAMATVVLKNPVYPLVYPDLLVASREMLMQELRPLDERGLLRLCESRTNFVFFRIGNAREMYEDLADRGILVRPVGEDGLRIVGGTQAQNRELCAILHYQITHEGGCYHEPGEEY